MYICKQVPVVKACYLEARQVLSSCRGAAHHVPVLYTCLFESYFVVTEVLNLFWGLGY